MVVVVNNDIILRKWPNIPRLCYHFIQKKIFKKREKNTQNG